MLEKGLSAQSSTTVDRSNVAATMGSGDLQVFATPAMMALMENAAMTAVAAHLPEGSTTVGAEMNVTHIKPSGYISSLIIFEKTQTIWGCFKSIHLSGNLHGQMLIGCTEILMEKMISIRARL